MHLKLNFKNLSIFFLLVAFGYITYLIWTAKEPFPEFEVELRHVASYAILAATLGGNAVVAIKEEKQLGVISKGKTAEGAVDVLTRADLVSNYIIVDVLKRIPGLKLITEEKETHFSSSELANYQVENYQLGLRIKGLVEDLPSRKVNLSSLTVWVDPLDATQEFTEGLLEYVTVMACIVEKGQPVFGVIHRPFANETWFGFDGYGVVGPHSHKWNVENLGATSKKVVISRSHAGKVQQIANRSFGDEYLIEAAGGAGYKVLRLINNTAALYLHTTLINKWDVCAGDAMLRSVGGAMIDMDGSSIDYNAFAPVANSRGIFAALKNPYTLLQRWRKVSSLQHQ